MSLRKAKIGKVEDCYKGPSTLGYKGGQSAFVLEGFKGFKGYRIFIVIIVKKGVKGEEV